MLILILVSFFNYSEYFSLLINVAEESTLLINLRSVFDV